MKEYLELFQNITNCVEQVLIDESNSLEIKQSAVTLRESVQPCLREIMQAGIRLKNLTEAGINDLDYAEDVWESKLRIVQVFKPEIWDKIGELSGNDFNVRKLAAKFKIEVIKLLSDSWEDINKSFKKNWFFDNKNNKVNSSTNVFEKDRLINSLKTTVEEHKKNIFIDLVKKLKTIYFQLKLIDVTHLTSCITQLDIKTRDNILVKINTIICQIESKFNNSEEIFIQFQFKELSDKINNSFDNLSRQSMLGVSLENFEKFSKEVSLLIKNTVISILDERVKLAHQIMKECISFYNDFLKKQVRYYQETPEQQNLEKTWIDYQRQQLESVIKSLEVVQP